MQKIYFHVHVVHANFWVNDHMEWKPEYTIVTGRILNLNQAFTWNTLQG